MAYDVDNWFWIIFKKVNKKCSILMLQCTLYIERLLSGVYMLYLQPGEIILVHQIIKKIFLLLVQGYYLLDSIFIFYLNNLCHSLLLEIKS